MVGHFSYAILLVLDSTGLFSANPCTPQEFKNFAPDSSQKIAKDRISQPTEQCAFNPFNQPFPVHIALRIRRRSASGPRAPHGFGSLQDLFDMLDVDGKGTLTSTEFADGLLQLLTRLGRRRGAKWHWFGSCPVRAVKSCEAEVKSWEERRTTTRGGNAQHIYIYRTIIYIYIFIDICVFLLWLKAMS